MDFFQGIRNQIKFNTNLQQDRLLNRYAKEANPAPWDEYLSYLKTEEAKKAYWGELYEPTPNPFSEPEDYEEEDEDFEEED